MHLNDYLVGSHALCKMCCFHVSVEMMVDKVLRRLIDDIAERHIMLNK